MEQSQTYQGLERSFRIWVFLQELINIRSKSKTKTALAGLANPSNPHTASCTWTLTVKVTTKTRHRALESVLQLLGGTPKPVPPTRTSTLVPGPPTPASGQELAHIATRLFCSCILLLLWSILFKVKVYFCFKEDSATSR